MSKVAEGSLSGFLDENYDRLVLAKRDYDPRLDSSIVLCTLMLALQEEFDVSFQASYHLVVDWDQDRYGILDKDS